MRPRTTAARRALQVVLLLGGFLALAFLLSGQAHADSPDWGSVRYARTPLAVDETAPTTQLHAVAQHAAQRFTADAQQTDRGVKDTVAAATSSVRPVTGLLGAVQDAAGQVTSPIAGATGAGHGDSGNPVRSAPTTATHQAVQADTASAARPTAAVAGRYQARAAHRAVSHHAHVTHQRRQERAPAQLPVPVGHSGHPCEGDGSTHHTGDAHAALFAGGARLHLGTDMPCPVNGSSPTRRSTDVSVQPD